MGQPPKKTGGWGSLLSGAVAGLESKLDNVFADEETAEAAKKARTSASPQKKTPSAPLKVDERPQSRSRVNDRLADRLAKAAKGGSSRPSSEVPSRAASPLPKQSVDIKRESTDSKDVGENGAETTLKEIDTGSGSARGSLDAPASATAAMDEPRSSSVRPSQDSYKIPLDSTQISDLVTSMPLKRTPSFLEAEVSRMHTTHEENTRNFQEELHAHLERIDALQQKLEYMTKQATATAREHAESAESGSLEKKLAEQEERNALLLEEGNKLSKNEVKQRGAIMKLRQRVQAEEKEKVETKQRLHILEEESSDVKDRLKIVEEREKAAQVRLKSLSKLEVDLDTAKRERDEARREIASLKKQLAEAERKADDAEKRALTDKLEEQMRVVAELNDDLSNARLEKRLVEDRAKAEMKQLRDDAARQQEKTQLAELELRSEIQNLETKLELLRSRSEDLTSSNTTDSQAKLLRQIETLQTQYSLASENWQTLESSLNSRITTLQKERDDISKREADVRRKVREANTKARRIEEDLEGERDKAGTFETELNETKAGLAKMRTRLEEAEREVAKAREEMLRERQQLEQDLQNRMREEKARWRAEHPPLPSPNPLSATASIADHHQFLGAYSPTTSRKASEAGLMGLYSRRGLNAQNRTYSELSPVMANDRPRSRHTPPISQQHPGMLRTNTGDSSQLGREASPGLTLNGARSRTGSVDDGMDRDSYGSPHRTVNELVSHSTMGAGPSVQLVERMSAAVRRLESEKAAFKEEQARLLAQRDEAREEVVGLMRENDAKRKEGEALAKLEAELKDVRSRYEASLEMLGEKSEEVEELRDDLEEVRKIYKQVLLGTGDGSAGKS